MKLHLALGALALLGTTLSAGELRPDRVPAEARWLVHVDVDAFRNTTLWHLLESGAFGDAKADLDEGFAEMRREFGIDPLRDVHSITVYGLSDDEDEAVAMIEASDRIDQALERVQKEPGYRAVRSGDLTVHAWGDDDQTFFAYVHPEGDRRTVLFSNQSARITDGIRMLYGQGASLRSSATGIAARPRQGSVAFLSAGNDVPGMDWIQQQSSVAGLLRGLTVDAGELSGRLYVTATAVTDDVEQATQVRSVVDGLRALALLGAGAAGVEMPLLVRDLIDAVSVQQRNREVVVGFEFDTGALVQELQKLEAETRRQAR